MASETTKSRKPRFPGMERESVGDVGAFGEFGIPIHVIEKTKGAQVRLSLTEFQGKQYIDIRQFYPASDGHWPTKKGVTIPVALYHELLRGVLELGGALGEIPQETLDTLAPSQSLGHGT